MFQMLLTALHVVAVVVFLFSFFLTLVVSKKYTLYAVIVLITILVVNFIFMEKYEILRNIILSEICFSMVIGIMLGLFIKKVWRIGE